MVAIRNVFVAVVLGLGLCPAVSMGQDEGPRRGIDKYLPADTEILTTVNIKQIFSSELFKKHGLGPARELLKSSDLATSILDELGFDPFKDLDKVISAGPGGSDNDKGIVILHGRFNLDKFQVRADMAARNSPDALKIHKINDGSGGQFVLYEVTVEPLPQALWVALADKNTLLASPGKDYLVDAMRQKGKPATLKNKDFQGMLEKMDHKQSFSVAAVGKAIAKAEQLPDQVKEVFESLEAIGGGVTVGEDINIELVANAKSAKAAKDVSDKISTGLNNGLAILALVAANQKELAPLVDVIKSIKTNAKEKTVIIKAAIPGELIEKLMKKE